MVLDKIVVNIKAEVSLAIKQYLAGFTEEEIDFLVEKPENESFGDYSSNVALVAAKILKKNPFELAFEMAKKINNLLLKSPSANLWLDKVGTTNGFINFYLSKEYLFSQLKQILEQKEKFGSKNEDLSKKVVVEYSSPNIAKPFTVGHLRSTIIGDAIANLLTTQGWKVYRDNHLGDWGTQFGKQIYAIKTWGDEKKIGDSQNPVKELVALYVKFHEEVEKNPELEEKAREWFKKLEQGDKEAKRLWQKCVDWSLVEFKKIYEKLGVTFTENNGLGYGEAFFEDKMIQVLTELEKKKLLKMGEQGAKLVFFEKDKYPPLMILKQDGATLYATRDLAIDKFRLEKYGKDIVVVNEVGAEQTLYFRQLFEVEKMLGWYKEGQRIHVRHGLYRFKDKKMSTRKGNTIWLEDVLKEAETQAKTMQGLGTQFIGSKVATTSIRFSKSARNHLLEDDQQIRIAREVGIGAIKWNDLKRTSVQDVVFDWDEILNMQGDSGPYIQYVFVRTQSVLTKAKNKINLARPRLAKLETEEASLLRALNRFPEIIEAAAENFTPNILCNYLFDLAQKFNLFYQKHKIIGSENQNFRLALTAGVGQVIKTGLNLLGIQAPEKM